MLYGYLDGNIDQNCGPVEMNILRRWRFDGGRRRPWFLAATVSELDEIACVSHMC